MIASNRTQLLIEELIGLIQQRINAQLNAILHHKRFQDLESAWRSLHVLLEARSKESHVQVKLLCITPRELSKDMLHSIDFDQSVLFQKIYRQEIDLAGGTPFGLLIGNYQFSHKPNAYFKDSIGVLSSMAKIASAAFAPFIAGVDPAFFGVENFSKLPVPFKIEDQLVHTEYTRWKALREEEDSCFIGLCLPGFLSRVPYNYNGIYNTNRFFIEKTQNHQDYLWGNAAFIFAAHVIECFDNTGWFANLRGQSQQDDQEKTTLLKRLYSKADPKEMLGQIATEFYLSDQQEKILSDAGFIPLKDHLLLQQGIFYNCNSIQKTKYY